MRDPTVPEPKTTVFFDGGCPLCQAEIGHYRRLDTQGVLKLVDVSRGGAELPQDLRPEQAMARFHVLSADGRLLSGAEAFSEVWRRTPGWRWAWRLSSLPGMMALLESGYRAFLRVRPTLVRLFVRLRRVRPRYAAPGNS